MKRIDIGYCPKCREWIEAKTVYKMMIAFFHCVKCNTQMREADVKEKVLVRD